MFVILRRIGRFSIINISTEAIANHKADSEEEEAGEGDLVMNVKSSLLFVPCDNVYSETTAAEQQTTASS